MEQTLCSLVTTSVIHPKDSCLKEPCSTDLFLAYLPPLKHAFCHAVANGKFTDEKYSWIQHQYENLNYPVKKNQTGKNGQVIAEHGNKGNQNHMVSTKENNFFLGPEAATEVQHNMKSCS